jgi:hypothetical protein
VRHVLRVFGIEVLSYEYEPSPVYEEIPEGISGGSTHDFERDLYPPDPTGEEPWEYQDFGFSKGG